ncbi:MAG: hypothetical protein QF704_03325 [Anaerolineales bacterium]|nr:hypothetical protein [Anaerolineales bacterium]
MDIKTIIRNLALELLVYGILVTAYAFIALRWLADPINALFHDNLLIYAFLGLVLIVAQAAILERLTTFLLERLGLPHSESE